jgi:hypothetical protein
MNHRQAARRVIARRPSHNAPPTCNVSPTSTQVAQQNEQLRCGVGGARAAQKAKRFVALAQRQSVQSRPCKPPPLLFHSLHFGQIGPAAPACAGAIEQCTADWTVPHAITISRIKVEEEVAQLFSCLLDDRAAGTLALLRDGFDEIKEFTTVFFVHCIQLGLGLGD